MSEEQKPSWGMLHYDNCTLCKEVWQIIKDCRLDVNGVKIKKDQPGPHPCLTTATGRHTRKDSIEKDIRRLCEMRGRITSRATGK